MYITKADVNEFLNTCPGFIEKQKQKCISFPFFREQLLQTVGKVRRQLNPKLLIDGILLTMVDNRTNFAKEISALLRETYGSDIKVFQSEIPHSVRAKETSAEGKSIFAYDPGGKVAEAYGNLTREVLRLEKQRAQNRAGLSR